MSTRGDKTPRNFEDVLLAGLAPDGGLYMPESWPQVDVAALKGKSYQDVAFAVMYPYVQGCIAADDFKRLIAETYNADVFADASIVPLHQLKDNLFALELFHGPTIAFKDVALQFLGRLFEHVLAKRNENVTIIGATSGDTGSAAIEGCRYSKHVRIFILHPKGRVSEVQRRQMTTVLADNVFNIALEGSFDDCQNLVKAMFGDADFRAQHNLSAVNSINWARIMAQVVYYFTAALALGAPEKHVSFVVPTGNFGNVLAGYVARRMGLPIRTLAIATNRNDILTRFFETGTMKTEDVNPTISPSMDIQISSNFERYLFDILGRDGHAVRALMGEFREFGAFSVPDPLLQTAKGEFRAYRCSEEETAAVMRQVHKDFGYTIDPHTAVGMKAALALADDPENGVVVALACAHPAKFPDPVENATGTRPPLPTHLADLLSREERVKILKNDIKLVQAFIAGHAA